MTPQRLEIFREVADSRQHPDAEAVFQAVRQRVPSLSLDTVYRTLWRLTDLGLLDTLGPRHGTVRFDANLRPHHHYVCIACGEAHDLEAPLVDEEGVAQSVSSFGTLERTHLEVRGICRRCAEAGAPRTQAIDQTMPPSIS